LVRKREAKAEAKRIAAIEAAATCKPGDSESTPAVTHAIWRPAESGADRRGPSDGWPHGRVRWYSTSCCTKCGATRLALTEWESP
jgi:hypothetical protein